MKNGNSSGYFIGEGVSDQTVFRPIARNEIEEIK